MEEFYAELSVLQIWILHQTMYVLCFCLQTHEGGEMDERNVNLVYFQGSFDICHSIHIE